MRNIRLRFAHDSRPLETFQQLCRDLVLNVEQPVGGQVALHRLGVPRQSLIKMLIARHLEEAS